ncbi:hypothetical protein NB311A_05168 [Nitrobacter sp. Nb-311A]|nr:MULTISPECIES: hypothetical protein [unclassified Nitrobacter]EAQ35780.1 hypothetical protein NB311A_05168 [Nitrobacter sp. Nb-311A]
MVFLIAAIPIVPAQAMSRHVAVSAGSFFAAASRCEQQNLITPGQTDELLTALDAYLSKSDKINMAAGRARGTKDSQVFVEAEKKWVSFTPDATSCYRVQGVLDDYRAQLGH